MVLVQSIDLKDLSVDLRVNHVLFDVVELEVETVADD